MTESQTDSQSEYAYICELISLVEYPKNGEVMIATEDVLLNLKRIYSELDHIFKSTGWYRVLNQTQEPIALENILGSAMSNTTDLILKVNRIVEAQKFEDVRNLYEKLQSKPELLELSINE